MIDSFEAQKVISQHRNNEIVIHTFTTSREWLQVSTNPDLDLSVGVAMGKASSVGLGLALAQPARKVIVLDGDGSLLMNLGSLVTIANMAPPNLIHFVFENGVYRTTGGQPIPNAGKFSFMGLAKEAGYANVHEFENLVNLENNIETVLNQIGPTFVCLKIPPATERPPFPFIKAPDAVPRFTAAVQRSPQ
ncbi:thiamine pyrophosphate-dependent enzyme [Chloroflexota bacterium]